MRRTRTWQIRQQQRLEATAEAVAYGQESFRSLSDNLPLGTNHGSLTHNALVAIRMKKKKSHDTSLDTLIAEITVDAYGDDEKISAFLQTFVDNISVPRAAFVHGEPVLIIGFDTEGTLPRIVAWCPGKSHSQYTVVATDLVLPPRSKGARYIAAYRKWLGLELLTTEAAAALYRAQKAAETPASLDPGATIDLVVLSETERGVRCRELQTNREITLRKPQGLVPGEIVVIKPRKQWMYARRAHLSGDIVSVRIDAAALGLTPLRLERTGLWQPLEEHLSYEYSTALAARIIAAGPRLMFEMEDVLPGAELHEASYDPIGTAVDFLEQGFDPVALEILMDLCESDLRCLDAHAHLGILEFDYATSRAIRHYEVGVQIGELSLGVDFRGVLLWGTHSNRPFLRCLQGYGLCLWRLGRMEEALRVFERMLWLNPIDNQGARFTIQDIKGGKTWEECEE